MMCFVAGLSVVWYHPSLAYTDHYQPIIIIMIKISVVSLPKQRWHKKLPLITEYCKGDIVQNYYDQA